MTKIKEYRDVEAVITVTAEEMHSLWKFYFYRNKAHLYKEPRTGHRYEIGKIEDYPICVVVWRVEIESIKVALVEATSLVVHYGKVEEWIKEVFPKNIPLTDRANFHHIFEGRERKEIIYSTPVDYEIRVGDLWGSQRNGVSCFYQILSIEKGIVSYCMNGTMMGGSPLELKARLRTTSAWWLGNVYNPKDRYPSEHPESGDRWINDTEALVVGTRTFNNEIIVWTNGKRDFLLLPDFQAKLETGKFKFITGNSNESR